MRSHIRGARKTQQPPHRSACSSADLLTSEIKYVSLYISPLSAQDSHRGSDFRAGAASIPIAVSLQWDALLSTPGARDELAELLAREQESKGKINPEQTKRKKKPKPLYFCHVVLFVCFFFFSFNLENELEPISPESHKGSNGKTLFGV